MPLINTNASAGTWNATVIQGEDWSPLVTAYQDDARTIPFVLTGWTGTLTIGGDVLSLSIGSGLSIGGASNNVLTITVTAAQSAVLPLGPMSWKLVMVDAGGLKHPWFSGVLSVIGI